MARAEFWQIRFPIPGMTQALAREAEENGWDGFVFADTQNLSGDPYTGLSLAAKATERLKLGIGVTNPVTRHPAVTASAIMTVQVESDGRAELGIGRGDSSLGYLGRDPAPVSHLERYLQQVQGYLRGQAVDLDGFASRLQWLEAAGQPKVPVHVAATGPRVIALAARHAERIMFAVGAELDRLRWAVALARTKRQEQGQDPYGVALGAYVNVVVHPDAAAARASTRGTIGMFAHFSGMRGAATELLRPDDRVVVERFASGYDMAHHGHNAAAHASYLTDEFIERFAVIGPPERCVARLQALVDLGLDRFIIVGPSPDGDPKVRAESSRLLAQEVIPALRGR